MLKFFRFLRGYARIEISGKNPHRFLNLCSKQGIGIWDMQCLDPYRYEMNLLAGDVPRLDPIAKKTGMKVVLLSKTGLPFRMQKYRRRGGFVAGLILCALALFLMSKFIWDIRLMGGQRLTQEMLLQFLSEQKIAYGSPISKIDIDGAEKALRDAFPYVVWTSFKLEGTRLFVYVKENTQNTETMQTDKREFEASDLVATVDGTVESIITRAGIPLIKAGDEVKKGDKLVSGVVPIVNDDETVRSYMPVKSDADILIRTQYSYDRQLPLRYKKKVYTQQTKTAFYVKIMNESFVSSSPPDFALFDVVADLKQARLMNDFYLPLYFGTISYREYEWQELTYTQKQIREILEKEFVNFCESFRRKGIQIIEKDVKIKGNMEKMRIHADLTVIVPDGDQFEASLPGTGSANQDARE